MDKARLGCYKLRKMYADRVLLGGHELKNRASYLTILLLVASLISCEKPNENPDPLDYDQLYSLLDSKQDEFTGNLISLISIPSISGDIEQNTKAIDLFLGVARGLGFTTRIAANGQVGVAEIGPDNSETVGVLLHLDVVPAEGQEWSFPPFEGALKDGWIMGRGAMDDKGPSLICLYAAYAAANMDQPLKKKIQLIMGTREEVDWTDIDAYKASNTLPDYGFVPDDAFPGSNREKGYADITWTFPETAVETGGNSYRIAGLSGGNALNTVPEQAVAILEGDESTLQISVNDFQPGLTSGEGLSLTRKDGLLRLTATGRSVHSSLPEGGINAIWILGRFLKTLSLAPNGGERLVDFISEYLDKDYYGKMLGFWNENDYLNGEFIHHTTVVPTLMVSGDHSFSLTCNLRMSFGIDRADVESALRKVETTFGSTGRIGDYLDPLYIPETIPFIDVIKDSYTSVTGDKSKLGLAYGTSYAKAMPNFIAWGPLFADDEDRCHEQDERFRLTSLMKAGKVYARFLATIGLSEESYKR